MERLNKLLAHAGVGSRRHVEELIVAGRVTVDGRPVRELGTKVDPQAQHVTVDGQPVKLERPVYWVVNKPRGYLCTNEDPAGRPRAIDLVPHVEQRVYTVGRLDEDSEGLLLLTNDGDLAHRLMHPRFGVEKTYQVQVAGHPSRDDLQQLLKGVWLSDGHVRAQRDQGHEKPGRQHLDADRAQRGEEPRNSPHAGPAQPQGAPPATGGHGTGAARQAAARASRGR